VLSFTDWNIVGSPTWIGLDNYRQIFNSDPQFWQSVKVTLTYALFYLPLEMLGGLGLAVLLTIATAPNAGQTSYRYSRPRRRFHRHVIADSAAYQSASRESS